MIISCKKLPLGWNKPTSTSWMIPLQATRSARHYRQQKEHLPSRSTYLHPTGQKHYPYPIHKNQGPRITNVIAEAAALKPQPCARAHPCGAAAGVVPPSHTLQPLSLPYLPGEHKPPSRRHVLLLLLISDHEWKLVNLGSQCPAEGNPWGLSAHIAVALPQEHRSSEVCHLPPHKGNNMFQLIWVN